MGAGHSNGAPAGRGELEVERAWSVLCRLADRAREGRPVARAIGLRLDGDALVEVPPADGWIVARPDLPSGWARPDGAAPGPRGPLEAMLDLYMPLCVGAGSPRLVVGHLAQSLDGRIATESGASQFISGQEDLEHAHRMRALFDAVLVGAGTVEKDDPRLTTRLVSGSHPTRVVLDPRRRLGGDYSVFRDGQSATLLVCAADPGARTGDQHGRADVLAVAADERGLVIAELLAALRARGLGRVFIEGGGVTLSRFLAAGALDRLHVAVAPCILGSGRAAFSLPVIDRLDDAVGFECRHFAMGPDILFDCALRAQPAR